MSTSAPMAFMASLVGASVTIAGMGGVAECSWRAPRTTVAYSSVRGSSMTSE